MAEQVADGDLAGCDRIEKLEFGQMPEHRVFPGEPAILHQQADRGGGERFGARTDRKNAALIDLLGLALSEQTKAAGEDGLPALNDRYAHPRYAPGGLHRQDRLIQRHPQVIHRFYTFICRCSCTLRHLNLGVK